MATERSTALRVRGIGFSVYWEAQPAGSKRAFHKPGMRFPVVVDANPKARLWKECVARDAARAMQWAPLFEGPVRLDVVFYRMRPASHFGTGRNAGKLKAGAPAYPTTKPDRTKLLRGLGDALKGIVWRDDAQVCAGEPRKEYGEPARVCVIVQELQSSARFEAGQPDPRNASGQVGPSTPERRKT